MAGKIFCITFNNTTDQTWHAGIYQKNPEFPGLDIIWKTVRLSRHTRNVPLQFELDFGIALAGVDGGLQQEHAEVGKAYQVTTTEEDIWSIDPNPINSLPPKDGIYVFNNTTPLERNDTCPLDIGFTLDGDLVSMMKGVKRGSRAYYKVHPSYYVALYASVTKGQMVDSGISIGPVEVVFQGTSTEATVDAVCVDGITSLKCE